MTSDDIQRLTPLVEGLQRRGVVATYATTSWPDSTSVGQWRYHHAFLLSLHGLSTRVTIAEPFTESALIARLARALANHHHAAAVTSAYEQSREQFMEDLAGVYAGRLLGKVLPVPESVNVCLRVDLPTLS